MAHVVFIWSWTHSLSSTAKSHCSGTSTYHDGIKSALPSWTVTEFSFKQYFLACSGCSFGDNDTGGSHCSNLLHVTSQEGAQITWSHAFSLPFSCLLPRFAAFQSKSHCPPKMPCLLLFSSAWNACLTSSDSYLFFKTPPNVPSPSSFPQSTYHTALQCSFPFLRDRTSLYILYAQHRAWDIEDEMNEWMNVVSQIHVLHKGGSLESSHDFSLIFLTGEKYTHLFNTSFTGHGSPHKEWSPKEMAKPTCFHIRLTKRGNWGNCGKVTQVYEAHSFFFFFFLRNKTRLTQLNRAVNQSSSTGLGKRKAHSGWTLWVSLCQRLKQGILFLLFSLLLWPVAHSLWELHSLCIQCTPSFFGENTL